MRTKKTPEQRLAELDAQQEKIERELKQRKERILRQKRQQQARLTNEKRKRDTRRKVLVGAAVLSAVEREEWPENRLTALLDAFLDRQDDRELFDLPPRFLTHPEPGPG